MFVRPFPPSDVLFVRVAPEIADHLEKDWSEPVQIRVERLEGNELRMILRTCDLETTKSEDF